MSNLGANALSALSSSLNINNQLVHIGNQVLPNPAANINCLSPIQSKAPPVISSTASLS